MKLINFLIYLIGVLLLVALGKFVLWGIFWLLGRIGLTILGEGLAEWINLVIFVGLGAGIKVAIAKSSLSGNFGFIILIPLVIATFLAIPVIEYQQWIRGISSEEQVSYIQAKELAFNYLDEQGEHASFWGFYLVNREGFWERASPVIWFILSLLITMSAFEVGAMPMIEGAIN